MIIYKYAVYALLIFSLICPFAVVGSSFTQAYWAGTLWLALIVFLSPGVRFMFDGNGEAKPPVKLLGMGALLAVLLFLVSLIAPNLLVVTLASIFLGIGALTHSRMKV